MRLIKKLDYTTKSFKYLDKRDSARAIVMDGDNILSIYIKKDNTYSIPGGGVMPDESIEEACIRELTEETGAVGSKILSEYGYVDEYRDSKYVRKAAFNMRSYYFLCTIEKIGQDDLDDYEKDLGFEPKWIKLDDAISHNEKAYEKFKDDDVQIIYLDRCLAVLYDIKRRMKL